MAKETTSICAYCGEPTSNATKDHVVPKALWVTGRRAQHPVMVPACERCHQGESAFDKEVEYFRNALIVMIDKDAHPEAARLLRGPVERSLEINPKLTRDFFRNMSYRRRQTSAGIITGWGWAFELDTERFNRMVEKIVRGLFFHKSGTALPATHGVEVFPGNQFWNIPAFTRLLESMSPLAGVGDDVFCCRCTRDSTDPCATAWLFIFYRELGILAWTERKVRAEPSLVREA